MEKAIKKAIENGYEPFKWVTIEEIDEWKFTNALIIDFFYNNSCMSLSPNDIFLDPLFWQALTKSLSLGQGCGFEKCPVIGQHKSCWLKVWHRFIDHLAEGKDTESFFNNLFTK